MSKTKNFDQALEDLFNMDRAANYRSINYPFDDYGIFRSSPVKPAILYDEVPDPDDGLFDGIGKKFGLPDFELEILIKSILDDEDLISELSSALVLAKMKYGDKVQSAMNVFNEVKAQTNARYQEELKEYQIRAKYCSFRGELESIVDILKSYKDGDEISPKMFSITWIFYQKFSVCEKPSIENHPDNPALYSVMIRLMDWKKVDEFIKDSDGDDLRTFLLELRISVLDVS